MNTDKNSPICVSVYPRLPVLLTALGLIIILAVSVSPTAFGVVYVNKDATGANDGSSWADAYTTIQVGIDYADVSDEEVWVAQGTYYEAIVMKSGVKLYGGFNGTETEESKRDWTTNVTTIDASTARSGSPAYHVVTMDSITSSTIDGFTITGGEANGESPNNYGGGIYCVNVNGSNTIANNRISENHAERGAGISCEYSSPGIANNIILGNSTLIGGLGGGIYCSSSSPMIARNTICRNLAVAKVSWTSSQGGAGAGIFCYESSPVITGNTITENTADHGSGGGILCRYHSSPSIIDNTIFGNSASYSGGGIDCYGSCAPPITNNTIKGNTAGHGGAIYCGGCSPTITNNIILENSAGSGAGIRLYYNCSPNIRNNIILGNSASLLGGGISCSENCSALIDNNTIVGNSGKYGGGISSNNSLDSYEFSPAIMNNVISGNSAEQGGAIWCHQTSPNITGNAIAGNLGSEDGGGIYCASRLYSPSILNNLIVGNSAAAGGAVFCTNEVVPNVTNNTISGNSATKGGGILCQGGSSLDIKNNIFSNNNNYDIFENGTRSDPIVTYNDFYGNPDGIYYDEGSTSYTDVLVMDGTIGECRKNIGLDPFFVSDTLNNGTWTTTAVLNSSTLQTTLTDGYASWVPNEHAGRLLNPDASQNRQFVIASNTVTTMHVWGDITAIAQEGDSYQILDYHLQNVYEDYPAESPCIDAGDPADDYSNEPMPNGGRINQGRYGNTSEAACKSPHAPTPTPTVTPTPTPPPVPGVVYVNINAMGANNGSSWADAYISIQEGIDDADINDEEVWVAQSNYYEAIVIKSGVKLYGGFIGTETERSQRDWTKNLTTIKASKARGGSPAYHAVVMDSITSATIDGLIITGADANGAFPDNQGGGICCYNLDESVTIANNTITYNWADNSGGGIYCERCSHTIMNNTVWLNFASEGGGIFCSYSSTPIINNRILDNSASTGAGIFCHYSSSPIINNSIWENFCSSSGGGFFLHGGGILCYASSPTIMSNTIWANSADRGGGIHCKNNSSPLIQGNRISENGASKGGGIYCMSSSSPTIVNNTIAANEASGNGAGISCSDSSPTIINNIIADNHAHYSSYADGGAIYCYRSSPTISNNTIARNGALTDGGGIVCQNGSSPFISSNTICKNGSTFGGAICCRGNSSPTIISNIMTGSWASSRGGAIFCSSSSPAIINNIVSGNWAGLAGGGIACFDSSESIITNNTISWNSASSHGGGIDCYSSSPAIRNNIFIKNNKYDIYEYDTDSDPVVSYNDFYGNADGVYYDEGTTPCTSVSVMDAEIAECSNNTGLDPRFVGDTLCGGTWTAEADYDSSTVQTILTDGSAFFTPNQHAGRLLNPDTSQNRQFAIVSNTETTITVWGDVTEIAQFGDLYKIFDYHLQPTSPCIDAGSYVSGLSQDYEGDPRPWDAIGELRGDGSDFDIGADEFIGRACIAIYDFITDDEGWTTGTAVVFSPPQWVFEPGSLKLVSQNNSNTFGYWASPENAIPVSEGYLYRARFTVSTDVTMQELVPEIRLRVNSSNFQQADCITIDSNGDGGASPTPDGITYDLYFVPPTNDDFCMLTFDLLNFNPYDAAHAELCLESVLIERFRLDTLDESTVTSWTYDFETSQEFWFPGDGTFTFTDPEFFWSDGALHLWSMTNTNTFGYWHNDPIDIIIEEDCLYRGTFEVRTDEADPGRVPQMRLRFNTANMQAARTLEISSIGDGANSPGVTNTTYDRLYFLPPPNCVGKGLIVSFDILNFSPDDAAEASLILDRATIETLSPPALP